MNTKTNGAANVAAKNPTPTGAPAKPELTTVTVAEKPEVQKPETSAPGEGLKPAVKLASIEERLRKLEELQEAVSRREALVDALDDVKKFDYKASTATPRLSFNDGRNSFSISNQPVIAECVQLAIAKLEAEIATVENQIAFSY